jgi:hypothetical protein
MASIEDQLVLNDVISRFAALVKSQEMIAAGMKSIDTKLHSLEEKIKMEDNNQNDERKSSVLLSLPSPPRSIEEVATPILPNTEQKKEQSEDIPQSNKKDENKPQNSAQAIDENEDKQKRDAELKAKLAKELEDHNKTQGESTVIFSFLKICLP